MPTMHPSAEPLVPDKIPSQESPQSPEWTHAITTLMGHPLSSEPEKHIQKWIIYHRIHKYTMYTPCLLSNGIQHSLSAVPTASQASCDHTLKT